MRDIIEALTHSSKFWIAFYLSYLFITNAVISLWFYIFMAIVIAGVSFLLTKYRLNPPPAEFVHEVFGSDEFHKRAKNGDFSFIPLTSRLAQASSPPRNRNNVDPYCMWIVGHRGAGLDAPENSLSAFRACKARGCTAVEFDIAVTKDNVPILFHDDDLVRVAGIDKNIRDMTWAELQQVDISSEHPLRGKFAGERIPTFDEAIRTCLDLDLRFFIDLKDADSNMADIVNNAFQKYGTPMYKRAVVSSFYPSVIYQIRKKDPKIIGSMAWRPGYHRYQSWDGSWENLVPRYTNFVEDWWAILKDICLEYALHNFLPWFLGLSVVLLNKDAMTRERVARWLKQGIRVFAWTVNSPLEKLHLTQNLNIGHLTDTLDGVYSWDLDQIMNQQPNGKLLTENSSRTAQTNGPSRTLSPMFVTPKRSDASQLQESFSHSELQNGISAPSFHAD